MATLEDLVAISERTAKAVEALLQKQADRNKQYMQRRANWWGMSPRRHIHKGLSHLLGGNVKKAGQEFGKAWKSFKATRGYAGTGVVGSTLAVVKVLGEFSKAIKQATDQAIAMNRHYAEMSSAMAGVMAQRDVKELMRDMRKGQAIAPSARMLTEAEQSRKDSHEQIDVLGARLENMALAGLNKLAEAILTPFNDVAGAINQLIDKLTPGDDKAQADLTQYVENVERRARDAITDRQAIFQNIAENARRARERGMFP